MTHDWNDSAASPARGLFASGIVLGVSLGLVAGHLLLFARNSPDRAGTSVTEEFPPFDPNGFAFSAEPDVDVPDDISFSIVEFGESEAVGRAKISDRNEDEQLHFFPEAVSTDRSSHAATSLGELDADEGNSAKRTWLASADEVESDRPVRKTVELPTATEEAPQALQPLPGASPIDERTQQREQLARSIVDEELPDATPQERDVWCEVLQGLPAEDIKGILRMRKHIGPGNPFPAISVLSPLAPREHIEPADEVPRLDIAREDATTESCADEDSVDHRLARIAHHNRANGSTVGFKRLVPVLVEVPWDDSTDGPATRIARVIRDMTPGELLPTNRLLDVAVYGAGFLQVRRGDDVRYTRDGRLTLDDEGRLTLLAHAEAWLLDPPVAVPPDATEVMIAENGHVTVTVSESPDSTEIGTISLWHFLNPESLQIDESGMYAPTGETGPPHQLPTDSPNAGTLVQGHLEASNAGGETP